MATTTTNFGWDIPQSTDLVKDGATAIAALGQDIDTAFVDLKGGTTGQVLAKASGTDLDFSWVAQDDSNAIQNAIVDAKGDLITATGADTPARLAVGTNGYVLTADSAEATGLKWAAAAGGGKVLQVVQGSLSGQQNTSSTTFADTGLTVSITPSATTSKVLVIASINGIYKNGGATGTGLGLKLFRGASEINYIAERAAYTNTDLRNNVGAITSVYLDSPSTTSSTTYKVQFASYVSGQIAAINEAPAGSIVSTITVLEIGA